MPTFDVHLRVTYSEFYIARVEADSVDHARTRAIDQDNLRPGLDGAEHVETEVVTIQDGEGGKTLWNDYDEPMPTLRGRGPDFDAAHPARTQPDSIPGARGAPAAQCPAVVIDQSSDGNGDLP